MGFFPIPTRCEIEGTLWRGRDRYEEVTECDNGDT